MPIFSLKGDCGRYYRYYADLYPRDAEKSAEISQIVSNLWGKVSRKTLLSQVPFVDDVDEELKAVEKEEQENLEKQQAMFGLGSNTPPGTPPKDDVDE
ncbi:MAG: phage portal protein [Gallintestinimicrobium sp.]